MYQNKSEISLHDSLPKCSFAQVFGNLTNWIFFKLLDGI
jgi:hypothetical protein